MPICETALEIARRHVAEGEEAAEQQRDRIALMQEHGYSTMMAKELLGIYERTVPARPAYLVWLTQSKKTTPRGKKAALKRSSTPRPGISYIGV
jgi:hypothetical protein